jgi:hypothetical protein
MDGIAVLFANESLWRDKFSEVPWLIEVIPLESMCVPNATVTSSSDMAAVMIAVVVEYY